MLDCWCVSGVSEDMEEEEAGERRGETIEIQFLPVLQGPCRPQSQIRYCSEVKCSGKERGRGKRERERESHGEQASSTVRVVIIKHS